MKAFEFLVARMICEGLLMVRLFAPPWAADMVDVAVSLMRMHWRLLPILVDESDAIPDDMVCYQRVWLGD